MKIPALRRAGAIVGVALAALAGPAQAQSPAAKDDASNMRLVGYSDLQGRSAYQPTIAQQGSRFIAYIGHHGGKTMNPLTGQMEDNGTSVLDVTDPKSPRYLAHIPGQPGEGEGGGAQMARICSGKDLPNADKSKVYLLRAVGQLAHEVWDVTAPEKPALLAKIGEGKIKDTHKNWWECDTGIAYLVSGAEGWRTRRMMQVYDLSNPASPKFIRDFGLPGQEPSAPDSKEARRFELHGPIRMGNRIYMGYGTFVDGVIQILDRDKLLKGNPAAADPLAPTPENLSYPVVNTLYTSPRLGAHTVLPLLGVDIADFGRNTEGKKRDFLAVTGESLRNECEENRQMTYMLDITTETRPWNLSNFNVPESQGNFCSRGGRFGTHSSNENLNSIYGKKVIFLAYFNAGVRAVDVRDPYSLKEVGHFIPAVNARTDKRCIKVDGADRCKVAIQTNNVEVDDRGYIYAVDRANSGLHVLELTGRARALGSRP
jgi:hypothetical protein